MTPEPKEMGIEIIVPTDSPSQREYTIDKMYDTLGRELMKRFRDGRMYMVNLKKISEPFFTYDNYPGQEKIRIVARVSLVQTKTLPVFTMADAPTRFVIESAIDELIRRVKRWLKSRLPTRKSQ